MNTYKVSEYFYSTNDSPSALFCVAHDEHVGNIFEGIEIDKPCECE